MKIGIVIDTWKLPIFERRLKQGGYTFEQGPFSGDTLSLAVWTENRDALLGVVLSANTEAAMTGKPR